MLVIKISLIAYVFYRLTEPEQIFAFYGKLISGLPEWLWKPLGGCVRCFVGQVCFWAFLFLQPYNIIEHLFFASAGIFLTFIYDIIYNHHERVTNN